MTTDQIKDAVNALAVKCFEASLTSGWYTDLITGLPKEPTTELVLSKLALIHSEVAEATEGYRKGLIDDHLRHRSMIEVELADTIIRIMDLAGFLKLDVGTAILEKMAYNAQRADHKIENRLKEGGKKA